MGYEALLDSTTVESGDTEGVLTLGSAVPAGDTVLGAMCWSQDSTSVPTVSSIVDSRGNTYVIDKSAGAGNSTASCAIFRGTVTTALQAGDTITVTIESGRQRWILRADHVSGLLTDPLDQTAANDTGSSANLSTGTTSTTTQADEFLYAAFGFGRGSSQNISGVGSGWTATAQVNTTSPSVMRGLQVAYRTVSATGAQEGTATATGTTSYSGCIATYKIGESHSGSATITASLGVSASGAPAVDGSAAVGGALAVTASGTPAVTGSASVGMVLTMTASGTADTGIGVPPRPRTRWHLVLGPASGGHELALTEARNRRYTARLTDNSDLSFSLDGRHPQAAAIAELSTDVHLLFSDAKGTRILDRCRVGPTRDEITEDEHRVEVTCLDYRAVLRDGRILYSTDTLTYESTDQAEIAWGLLDTTQQQPGGSLGIAKAWSGINPTGIDRDRTYEAGDSVGQRIQELSEVEDGFDWDITPVSASGLRLDLWYPARGASRGVILILGGLVAAVQREVDTSTYANAIRYTGAQGDDETPGPDPREIAAPQLDQPGAWPQGRWDAVFGDDGLTTQAALNARAAWQLAESQAIRPVYTVRLRRGGWQGPDHIWLGDTVRLIVPSGRLQVDTQLRVHEVQLDIDEDGGETATLTLGGPRPDFRRWPSRVDRRLKDLERR